METIERTINAERIEQLIDVFGSFDENIKRIEAEFSVRITNRDHRIQGSASADHEGDGRSDVRHLSA